MNRINIFFLISILLIMKISLRYRFLAIYQRCKNAFCIKKWRPSNFQIYHKLWHPFNLAILRSIVEGRHFCFHGSIRISIVIQYVEVLNESLKNPPKLLQSLIFKYICFTKYLGISRQFYVHFCDY